MREFVPQVNKDVRAGSLGPEVTAWLRKPLSSQILQKSRNPLQQNGAPPEQPPGTAGKPLTLNISRFAALSLSSIRELERGLDASLSERTIISGEGVNRPLSWSLRNRKDKRKKRLSHNTTTSAANLGAGQTPLLSAAMDANRSSARLPVPAEPTSTSGVPAFGQKHRPLAGGKRLIQTPFSSAGGKVGVFSAQGRQHDANPILRDNRSGVNNEPYRN